ncbi:hypothetical protein J6590_068587 [Homalodisca vitripennis]|nr:hypothetical protein J6590_068587 [Homalodisca vitripennis]
MEAVRRVHSCKNLSGQPCGLRIVLSEVWSKVVRMSGAHAKSEQFLDPEVRRRRLAAAAPGGLRMRRYCTDNAPSDANGCIMRVQEETGLGSTGLSIMKILATGFDPDDKPHR